MVILVFDIYVDVVIDRRGYPQRIRNGTTCTKQERENENENENENERERKDYEYKSSRGVCFMRCTSFVWLNRLDNCSNNDPTFRFSCWIK